MCVCTCISHIFLKLTICKIEIFSEILLFIHLHVHCKAKRLKNKPYQDKTFTHGYDVWLNTKEQLYCVYLLVPSCIITGTELHTNTGCITTSYIMCKTELTKLYLIVQ